jgi:hypothetical protein
MVYRDGHFHEEIARNDDVIARLSVRAAKDEATKGQLPRTKSSRELIEMK